MRDRHPEIQGLGAEVVAIGTGDARYAQAFVHDEDVPYLVLVDDEGIAARAASVRRSWFALGRPSALGATIAATRHGFRVHRPGRRMDQLGATFVVGPGPVVRYEHVDRDPGDHAPLDEVIAALQRP